MKITYNYDDTTPATKRFVKHYENKMLYALAQTPKKYSWGAERYEVADVKKTFNRLLARTGFYITDRVDHAHNIGNNNSFEVEYTKDGVTTIVARMCLNDNMYGGILHYVTDLSNKKISGEPKLPVAVKPTTKDYLVMYWKGHETTDVVVHRDNHFWKGFRGISAFERYITSNGGSCIKDKLEVAQTGCLVQHYIVTMKEILDY